MWPQIISAKKWVHSVSVQIHLLQVVSVRSPVPAHVSGQMWSKALSGQGNHQQTAETQWCKSEVNQPCNINPENGREWQVNNRAVAFPNFWAVLCSEDALRAWPRGLGTPEPGTAMKIPWDAAGGCIQTLSMNCSWDGILLLGDSSPTELVFTANRPSQQAR